VKKGQQVIEKLESAAAASYPPNKVAALKKNDSYEITTSAEIGVGRGAAEEQFTMKVTRDDHGLFTIDASAAGAAGVAKSGGVVDAKFQAAAAAKLTFHAATPEEAKKLADCLMRYGTAAYSPVFEGMHQLHGKGSVNANDSAFLLAHVSDVTVSGAASFQADKAFGNEATRRAVGAAFQGATSEKVSTTIHFQGGRATTAEVSVETSGKISGRAGAGVARDAHARTTPAGLPLTGLTVQHEENVSVTVSTVYPLHAHVDPTRMIAAPLPVLTQLEGQLRTAGTRSIILSSERQTGLQGGAAGGGGSGASGQQSVTTNTLVAKGYTGNEDVLSALVLVVQGDLSAATRTLGPGAQVTTSSIKSNETTTAIGLDGEFEGVGLKLKGQVKERHRETGPTHGVLELPPRPIYA